MTTHFPVFNIPEVRNHLYEFAFELEHGKGTFDVFDSLTYSIDLILGDGRFDEICDELREMVREDVYLAVCRVVSSVVEKQLGTQSAREYCIGLYSTVAVICASQTDEDDQPFAVSIMRRLWNVSVEQSHAADNHPDDSDTNTVEDDSTSRGAKVKSKSKKQRQPSKSEGVTTLQAAYSTALVWAGVSDLNATHSDVLELLAVLIFHDATRNFGNRTYTRTVRGLAEQYAHELGKADTFKENGLPRHRTLIHEISLNQATYQNKLGSEAMSVNGRTGVEIVVRSATWDKDTQKDRMEDVLLIAGCEDNLDDDDDGTETNLGNYDKEAVTRILTELDAMPGLGNVKNVLREQVATLTVNRVREERGGTAIPMNRHLVFTGEPGTGKTTIARKVAELYTALGVLRTGEIVETDRAGLIGQYLGETTGKVSDILDEARGGVLFIDEAYALIEEGFSHGDPYGSEALNTIVKYMEDHRDDLVVIFAGYSDEMETFIDTNPGLSSRIGRTVHFDSYTPEELVEVMHHIAGELGLTVTDDAAATALTFLANADLNEFGNARGVRNLVEAAVSAHALRVADDATTVDYEVLFTLETDDIRAAITTLGLDTQPKTTIGFVTPTPAPAAPTPEKVRIAEMVGLWHNDADKAQSPASTTP